MMGGDFAKVAQEYVKANGGSVSGFGIIKANSEKSKHLETATMMINGQSIDFVNLRGETYSEDSRIPTAVEKLSSLERKGMNLADETDIWNSGTRRSPP